MQDWPGLQVLDEWQEEVVNLLGAVLELCGLPDDVGVVFRDLSLHGKEVQEDVRLFDDFDVERRTKGVLHDAIRQNPTFQQEAKVRKQL